MGREGTFLSVLSLYALTTAPPRGGDPRIIAESCSLGTAHPPGYPPFTLLYHTVNVHANLFQSGEWANLFTATIGAGASSVVCQDHVRSIEMWRPVRPVDNRCISGLPLA